MTGQHILIVEDEEKIRNVLHDYVENAGFQVTELSRGDRVLPFFQTHAVDLILLDVMLPGMDGIEICREIRKISTVPIIMITAKIEEVDRLLGLELGADDYICKPFSPREVIARMKAVLRRSHPEKANTKLVVGDLELDEDRHQVLIQNQEIRVTPIEFGLLKTMLARPNRVFSRDELMNQVQGYEFEGYDRTIDSHIKNLRKKIAAVQGDLEWISSVYGVGYKLNALHLKKHEAKIFSRDT